MLPSGNTGGVSRVWWGWRCPDGDNHCERHPGAGTDHRVLGRIAAGRRSCCQMVVARHHGYDARRAVVHFTYRSGETCACVRHSSERITRLGRGKNAVGGYGPLRRQQCPRCFVANWRPLELVRSICPRTVTLWPSARTVIVWGKSTPRKNGGKDHHAKTTTESRTSGLGAATLGGIGLIGAFGAGTASAAGTPGASPVIGHVYLDDNTVGTNTISGFDRHADGSLTPLAGSPFVAGGAGTGAAVGSHRRARSR